MQDTRPPSQTTSKLHNKWGGYLSQPDLENEPPNSGMYSINTHADIPSQLKCELGWTVILVYWGSTAPVTTLTHIRASKWKWDSDPRADSLMLGFEVRRLRRLFYLCDSLSHPAQKDYLLDLNPGKETVLGSGPENEMAQSWLGYWAPAPQYSVMWIQ